MKRTIGAMLAALCAMSAGSALGHSDPNADGNRYDTRRCDTYYRPGHESGSQANKQSHHHTEEDDIDAGVAYVHHHTGHYVVRGDGYYVEVVGGSGHNRDGNQGGWVQGEVDLVEGAPDADFHSGAYAGTTEPHHAENACVSVADNKIGESGAPDHIATNCVLDPGTTTCRFIMAEAGLRVYSEVATGTRILIERRNSADTGWVTHRTISDDELRVNHSRSFVSPDAQAGYRVTCTLTQGAAPQPLGRLLCSG